MHAVETAPIEEVPLEGLTATQPTVSPREVASMRAGKETPKGRRSPRLGILTDLPIIVRSGGRMLIHDGHHRLTAAKLEGETSVRARVVTISSTSAWARSQV